MDYTAANGIISTLQASAPNNQASGFTPVRRDPSTLIPGRLQNDTEKDWTAARCNRLLRVLTSRVAYLRSDVSRLQNVNAEKSQRGESKCGVKRGKWNIADDDHMEWNAGRKRIKRTYGRGGRIGQTVANRDANGNGGRTTTSSQGAKALAPGEIVVPTPVFNRARGSISDMYPEQLLTTSRPSVGIIEGQPEDKTAIRSRTKGGQAQLSESMRELKKSIPASRFSTYEGIFGGLDALLKATAPKSPVTKRKGASSLLSTCLKTVPQYIAEEQAFMEAELRGNGTKSAINNRDVSTEIYDHLESFGTSNRGWKNLRIVVRSHGIQVILDAVQDGLLDIDFCGALATLCVKTDAMDEAEALVSAMLNASILSQPKTIYTRFSDNSTTRALTIFRQFVNQNYRPNLHYRQLSRLLETEQLPPEWLATREFAPILCTAIQHVSFDLDSAEPWMFMQSVISKLADLNSSHPFLDAMKQTYSSLLTTLTAIAVLCNTSATRSDSHDRQPTHGRIIDMLRTCLARHVYDKTDSHGSLLALGTLIAGTHDTDRPLPDIRASTLLLEHIRQCKTSSTRSSLRNFLVAFLCSVSQCCGRGTATVGFDNLQQFHSTLESFASDMEKDGSNFLHELIVDSALAFSHEAPDRQSLEYATTVEIKFHVVKTREVAVGSTPRKSSGFRWEEGISEWVAATPAPKVQLEKDWADSSDCETPLRVPVRRQRVVNANSGLRESHRSSSTGLGSSPSSVAVDSDDGLNHNVSPSSNRSDLESASPTVAAEELASSSSFISANADEQEDDSTEDDDLCTDSLPALIDTSLDSNSNTDTRSSRQYIERAPRLGRKVLRKSLSWQLLEDESDDELSFVSTSSSQTDNVLRDLTNNTSRSTQTRSRTKRDLKHFKPISNDDSLIDVSEDELGA